jgi:hypothetical protein
MIIPQTDWLQPQEYPDLRQYEEIAIDLETKDPDLKKLGTGSIVGNGEVVGIAVAVEGYRGYFPIAHGEGPNMDRHKTLEWFKDICESPATKIFHNAMYDVCWIRSLGININGLIIDTMIASSLIDENRFSYTLNTMSWAYLNKGKNETKLIEAAKERGLDAKAEMWKLPAHEVGAYAEQDAELTLELWQKLKKIIIEDDLQDIFNLETDLFPCLVDMRFPVTIQGGGGNDACCSRSCSSKFSRLALIFKAWISFNAAIMSAGLGANLHSIACLPNAALTSSSSKPFNSFHHTSLTSWLGLGLLYNSKLVSIRLTKMRPVSLSLFIFETPP